MGDLNFPMKHNSIHAFVLLMQKIKLLRSSKGDSRSVMKSKRNFAERKKLGQMQEIEGSAKMIQYARNIHLIKATHVLHRIKYTFMMNHIADACRGIVNQTRGKSTPAFTYHCANSSTPMMIFIFPTLVQSSAMMLESH